MNNVKKEQKEGNNMPNEANNMFLGLEPKPLLGLVEDYDPHLAIKMRIYLQRQ